MRAPGMTLDELNAGTAEDFVAALGAVFEDAPWVAARASALRPFPTVAALHEAMMGVVSAAPASVRLAFLRGHPDLAGAAARARTMGAASTAEQAGLGLASLDGERLARFEAMNAAYRERHGIPFILCVRRHTRASVLAQFARRLPRGTPAEQAAAYLSAWASKRGLDVRNGPPSIGAVLGTAARQQLRARLVRRLGRNVSTLAPFLAGALAGAELNRRETRNLGEALLRDLHRR